MVVAEPADKTIRIHARTYADKHDAECLIDVTVRRICCGVREPNGAPQCVEQMERRCTTPSAGNQFSIKDRLERALYDRGTAHIGLGQDVLSVPDQLCNARRILPLHAMPISIVLER